ncbi:MAG TPA: hypothetical protein VF668_19375 [Pyrinomonadaceae bacterium]|jgi:hypothetical protein
MSLRRLPAGLLPLLLLLVCAGARAQEHKQSEEMHGRDALRGLEAVRLRVETVPEQGAPGVTAALVERGAAERLRAAGLRVLTGEEAKGAPVLFYRVTLITSNCGYMGTADMQLREAVRVSRAPGAEATAATWQHVARIHFDPPNTPLLVEKLASLVDVFTKEHGAANGR